MSDISTIGGALGLGNPSYDPSEAKGYLSELDKRQKGAQHEYDDVIAQRRRRVDDMSKVLDEATKSLVESRVGRVNLPMMAAASGLLAPTRTGGFGESVGNALGLAGPALSAQRRDDDESTLRNANLKTIPINMVEGIDRDVTGQLATRLNTNLAQRTAVERGMLTSQTAGMKQVSKDIDTLRKQASQEAKNEMAAALRTGDIYAEDESEVMRKMTDAKYAQLFHQKFGMWPQQATGSKDLTPSEIEASVPRVPARITKETKDDREYYGSVSNAGQAAENNISALTLAQPPPGTQVPGLLAPIAVQAGRLAEFFNVGGDWGKKLQDASTDVGKMKGVLQGFVLDLQKQQKGVQTEGDAQRMARTIADISNPEELNKVMFNWMKSQALGAKYQADVADEFVKGQRNRASGIRAHLNENARLPLIVQHGEGKDAKNVTLWEFYEGFRKENPAMDTDTAQREAVKLWKSLQ